MNYASIRTCDIANGEGVRVSLFVSGCRHRCKGCFNEEAQAFDFGRPFTREVEEEILKALEPAHIAGLTILGGEPMEPENQRALVPFLRRLGSLGVNWRRKATAPDLAVKDANPPPKDPNLTLKDPNLTLKDPQRPLKTLWVYTGCIYERLLGGETYPWRCEVTDELLSFVDVLVDGPFVEDLKDISLRFRGSSNQRILELP